MRIRPILAVCAVCLLGGGVLLGCGTTTTNVSQGVQKFNTLLNSKGFNVTLSCPTTVNGGAGTQFQCSLTGPTGKTTKVQLKIVSQNGSLAVEQVNTAAFENAINQVGTTT